MVARYGHQWNSEVPYRMGQQLGLPLGHITFAMEQIAGAQHSIHTGFSCQTSNLP